MNVNNNSDFYLCNSWSCQKVCNGKALYSLLNNEIVEIMENIFVISQEKLLKQLWKTDIYDELKKKFSNVLRCLEYQAPDGYTVL